MRLPFLIAASLGALMLAGCGPSKEQMESTIKDYLMANPKVIIDAVNSLQAQEEAKQDEQLKASADKLWETLKVQIAMPVVDPHLGPENAPITIVEYTDYNCPYCRQANAWVMAQVDNPKRDVRVIFKEMPIKGDDSVVAAQAAIAAHMQGKYREMHTALMQQPDVITMAVAEKVAKQVGLDINRWKADMKSRDVQERIARTHAEAETGEINGTPTFFINGKALRGFGQDLLDKMVAEARLELAKPGPQAGSR